MFPLSEKEQVQLNEWIFVDYIKIYKETHYLNF